MKKISFFTMLLVVLSLGLTGCKDDTQPRLQPAPDATFKLNVPQMASNTYALTPNGEVEFSVSQPDYGVATTPNYTVQISLSENFQDATETHEANYQIVKGSWTKANFAVPAKNFAIALNKLNGINKEEDEILFEAKPYEVYVRCIADIPYCDYAHCVSNVIKLDAVVPYFVVSVPGVFYITGGCNGWPTPDETYLENSNFNDSWMMVETEAESGIFVGTIEMTPEQASEGFRFYNALSGWGSDGVPPALGATPNDFSNKDVEINGQGVYAGSCTWGKGNFRVVNWPGGKMQITINTNEMNIEFKLVKE